MKKFLRLVFIFGAFFLFNTTNVFAADVWDGTIDISWYDGAQNSFTISTAEEFAGLAKLVNEEGVTFNEKSIVLAEDIDLNSYVWTPIGNSTNLFAGNFDGANHIINGLTDGNGTGSAINTGSFGLFGYIANVNEALVIQNLNLTNVNIKQTASGKGVGALVSYANEIGVGLTIKNVTVSGSVEGIYHVGGVVGKTYSGGTILFENVVNNAAVTNKGNGMTGGIVGIFSHTGSTTKPSVTFKNVTNNGEVSNATEVTTFNYSDAMQVSGICGNVANAVDVTFDGVVNEGRLSSPGLRQMSGIANIEGAKTLTFKDCTNNGNIEVTNANNYNTDKSTANLNKIGGLFADVSVEEKIIVKGINSNNATIGTLKSDKVYSGNYAGGIFGTINSPQKDILISIDADAKLINNGVVYARQYAGGIAGLYKAISNVSGGTFENYGDVIVKYEGNSEISAAGGIFGTIINLKSSGIINSFKVLVSGSEIIAYGYGQQIHVNPNNAVAAGGYIGYNPSYNVSNSNITIQNSTIKAVTADVNYKQAYAGGVFGLNALSASNNTEVGSLDTIIVSENEIESSYAGDILGAAYDSYSASGRNLLNVTGNALIKNNTVTSKEQAFDSHLGLKINKAYITLNIVEEYTITFETNGGNNIDPVDVPVYTKLEKPADPKKNDYAFEGWYTDDKLLSRYNFDEIIDKDLILYAKWTAAVKNPETSDNILVDVIIACISLLSLGSAMLYLKRNN